jgi:hypothetical protein
MRVVVDLPVFNAKSHRHQRASCPAESVLNRGRVG